MKQRLLSAFFGACVVLFGARAHAQSGPDRTGPPEAVVVRPEVMQRVTRALFVVEGEAPEAFFATLGAEGREALLSIAQSDAAVGLRRRAVLALHHYPEPTVRAALVALLTDEAEDAIVSRYAARTLAEAFDAFDEVAQALDDPRAVVREGAALSLGRLDPTRAIPLLRARASVEPDRFVREAIARLVR